MYHGGTNFARTAGGPLITTTYDYDAPLSSYGMPNEPKYSHLARLHFLIREFEDAMFWDGEKEVADIKVLSRRDRTGLTLVGNSSSGNWLEAHVHGDPTTNSTTGQLAFLSNIAEDGEADIEFNGVKVTLKAWSVVILARKGKTGKGVEVEKEKWTVRFDSAVPRKGTGGKELDGRRGIVEGYSGTVDETEGGDAGRPSFVEPSAVWEAHEPLSVLPEGFPKDPRKSHSRTIRNAEQLRTGLGASDYQVHRLSYLPERSQKLEVRVTGVYEVGYVFLGNSTCGGCMGAKSLICTCRTDERVLRPRQQAPSPAPAVDLTILTATIGLDNYGARLEETVKGITGRVEVNGRDAGTWEWKVLVGLYGEAMQVGRWDAEPGVEKRFAHGVSRPTVL